MRLKGESLLILVKGCFDVEGYLYQLGQAKRVSKTLFIAERIVEFLGIGLPIVHNARFCFMRIVGNEKIHKSIVFEEQQALA